MIELKNNVNKLSQKIDLIQTCFEREFGGKDIAGNSFIGNTHKELKEINTRLDVQNGRVKTLWDWRNYVLGGIAMFGFITAILVAVHK